MQTNDVSAFHTIELLDDGATEHPAGGIALGRHGALGLRSRLLRVSEGESGYTNDLPFTTMTII
ncbi:hypothetical protein AB0D98_26775 [Streptomyces sp. NPDC047987]|uniref:hypothetical protein n=1 Tax=unclassified Streptomyces TaxID=2593676 RepID=UPI00344212A3